MSNSLPFVNSTGALKRLLQSIQTAKTPAKFTYDYMNTEMSVSERAMIPLLKKMGFLNETGIPTEVYKDFRNPDKSKSTMGKAIEKAYEGIYNRNEYIHNAKKAELKSIVASVSGLDHDSKTVESIINTFEALKSYASFEYKNIDESSPSETEANANVNPKPPVGTPSIPEHASQPTTSTGGLNLGYTINLILPETTNIEVFNVIFKSLNENLLRR